MTLAPIKLNVRLCPAAFGDLPPNFDELVGNRMPYTRDGNNVIVFRSDVALADPSLEGEQVWQALAGFFAAHAEQSYIILEPS